MKYVMIAIAMTFALSGSAEIYEAGPGMSNFEDGTGAVRIREKTFIRFKNGEGSAIIAGQILCQDLGDDDGYSLDLCDDEKEVPICLAVEAVAASAWGKCQTYGYYSAAQFTESGTSTELATAGQAVYISEDDPGYVKGMTTPKVGQVPAGVFLDDASASGEVEVFLKMR